nr:zinc finger MYM-type protein 5-like [Parasteatoda tepidariorum]
MYNLGDAEKGEQNQLNISENLISDAELHEEMPGPEKLSQFENIKEISNKNSSVQNATIHSEKVDLIRDLQTHFSSDPAEWNVTVDLKHCIAKNPVSQDLNCDFKFTCRQIGDKNRHVTKDLFFRKLSKDEIIKRDWLILSKSTGKLYCYVCKLFSSEISQNVFQTGFNDWKNAHILISSHEQSKNHITSQVNLINYQKTIQVDKELIRVQEETIKYWTKVLERVFAFHL